MFTPLFPARCASLQYFFVSGTVDEYCAPWKMCCHQHSPIHFVYSRITFSFFAQRTHHFLYTAMMSTCVGLEKSIYIYFCAEYNKYTCRFCVMYLFRSAQYFVEWRRSIRITFLFEYTYVLFYFFLFSQYFLFCGMPHGNTFCVAGCQIATLCRFSHRTDYKTLISK